MKKITSLLVLLLFCISVAFAQQKKQKKYISFNKNTSYSLQNAKELIKKKLKLSSDEDLTKIKTESDQIGYIHEKYQQYFQGIKVEFGTYTVHAKNSIVKSMSGLLYNAGKLNINPTISNITAFNIALRHTGAEKYLWEYPEAAKEMDNYKKPEGELLILPAEVIDKQKARLAYKFDIYALKPLSRGYLYIDAHTGEVLFFNAIIKHANEFGYISKTNKTSKKYDNENDIEMFFAVGQAQTRYSGNQVIETSQSGGNFILSDVGRSIHTRNANHQAAASPYPYINNFTQFTDNDNNWTTAEHSANKDDAALDAHWAAIKTYDYWQNIHNRDSYDNNGAQIRSYVHVGNNYDNAFWNGSVMSYGDGSSNGNEGNGSFDALTSIDVGGHEIGHAVCSFTADLAYQKESGALNEGFSDIWGAAIEHYAKGNGNDLAPASTVWLIGEEIDRRAGSAALRSMSNPKSQGQPDTYGGVNWVNINCGTPVQANDYCGVHTNSGVLNHWFYLLTQGGAGTNDNNDAFNVIAIGIDKSAKIAYRLESVYLNSNATFADARTGAIQSAIDLYGAGSTEVISTTNAWYAVGVGAAYVQTCALGAPANFASSNVSNNGFTLTWNTVSGAASYTVTVGGSNATVNGTSYTATGLNPGTAYACSVVANCSTGGSGASSSTNVTTTGSAPVTYCSSASTNTNDEYIQKVQLNTINNASGAQFYSDFTSISTSLDKGAQYTITVTPKWTGTIYNEGYSVWIDYNHDGDFADAGEQVFSKAASKTTPVSGTFTIPTGATSGNTRMRVSMKYNAIPTVCETFTYGEVEDYTVNIVSAVADTTAPVITLNGAATINLNVGGTYTEQGATATDNVDGDISANIVIGGDTVNTNVAGTYVVTYDVSDAAGNAATQVTRTVIVTAVADTTAPVITLNGAATINLNVGDTYTEQGATATDNVDGDISANIVIGGDVVNTNNAGTYAVTYNVSDAAGNAATQVTRTVIVSAVSTGGCTGGIASFPYNEGFENTLGAWTQSGSDDFDWTVDANGTPSSSTGPSSASQGTYYVYMESSSPNYSSKRAILNSPCFDLSAETQATFAFKYHMYGASTMGSLALEVSTDNGTTWTSVWNMSGNQGNAWLSATVDLAAYIGGTVQLRFNGITGTTWQGDMAVDDVSLTNAGGGTGGGGCSNVSLSITFDNYPEETSWEVKDSTGAIVASGGTYASQADGSTLNISVGCLPDGCYDFIMKDSYGDGICCSYGNGSYTLTNSDTGATLASGGSFTSTDTTNFCLTAGAVAGFSANTPNSATSESDNIFRVQLYPNPVKGDVLNIRTTSENVNYMITNMIGQLVAKGQLKNNSIDVNALQGGVYLIELSSESNTITKKFVKE